MLLNVDLQKAYDTVEWEFVEDMLIALNFLKFFINLVMQCVKTSQYILSIKENQYGYFEGK